MTDSSYLDRPIRDFREACQDRLKIAEDRLAALQQRKYDLEMSHDLAYTDPYSGMQGILDEIAEVQRAIKRLKELVG